MIFVFCERTGNATPHARGSNPKEYKIYHTLPWWLNTAVKCTRVADYHPKIPCITVGVEYHGSMYQSGRLPSKKYRPLPWRLSTTVACTRVADYRPKNTVHYRGV